MLQTMDSSTKYNKIQNQKRSKENNQKSYEYSIRMLNSRCSNKEINRTKEKRSKKDKGEDHSLDKWVISKINVWYMQANK